MGWTRRALNRLRFEAHWRCAEPVVVLESDDWGLQRKRCTHLLAGAGEPTDWAEEETETKADVEALTELLGGYRDEFGQPACITANFVVSNPDYPKIRDSQFENYESVALDAGTPAELLSAYRRSRDAHCFLPQYHGLRHFSPNAMLRDLRTNVPYARKLFDAEAALGLSFLKGHLWRYYSEYEDWNAGGAPYRDTPAADLHHGLDLFERCFGFRPASTMPPHYLWNDSVRQTLRQSSLRYVQGAGYRLRRKEGGTSVSGVYLGFTDQDGLTHTARTAALEPRPGRPETAARALEQAEWLFSESVPVVVDTHRINYSGGFRDRGLDALRTFLDGVARRRPRFLSTEQLGDAIVTGGLFQIRGGGTGKLTPLQSPAWRAARATLAIL